MEFSNVRLSVKDYKKCFKLYTENFGYPALNKYCEKQGYKDSPVPEIYDVPGKKIIYRKKIYLIN